MRLRLAIVIISLGMVASLGAQTSQPPAGVPRRAIHAKDLFDFIWVANPQLSPDGTRVAFTRVNVDEKRTGYETSIWLAATSGSEPPVRMTNGKHDAQPRWSPDSKRIAFVRGGDKDETGKPKPPQIAMLSLAGGEARIITALPKGAAGPVWSPDSRRIAFLSSTTLEDIEKYQRKKAATKSSETKESEGARNTSQSLQPELESEHESDVHVISRAVYRSNDEGISTPSATSISGCWTCPQPPTSSPSPRSSPAAISTSASSSGVMIIRPCTSLPSISTNLTTNFRPRIFTPSPRRVEVWKSSPLFPWASAPIRSPIFG